MTVDAGPARAPGWALYTELLAGIPIESTVGRCLIGQSWTVLESQPPAGGGAPGTGLAMTFPRTPSAAAPGIPHDRSWSPRRGRRLRDVAAELVSWDLEAAAAGMAATNAHYNRPELIEKLIGRPLGDTGCDPVFATMADEVEGKKVAVVGHFAGLEDLERRCRLTILERLPLPGDLPDPACEYVLPEQDYVFITGTTIINKTLPRLLELSAGAHVALVGPSVPFAPLWFDRGVDVLAGSIVVDRQTCWDTACEGGAHEIWDSATVRLQLRREDVVTPTVAAIPATPTTTDTEVTPA